jgi:hypothetical protein
MRETLEAAANALVRTIMENREKYLQAWVAETGLPPSECELVEEQQVEDGRVVLVVSVRPRAFRAFVATGAELDDIARELGLNRRDVLARAGLREPETDSELRVRILGALRARAATWRLL